MQQHPFFARTASGVARTASVVARTTTIVRMTGLVASALVLPTAAQAQSSGNGYLFGRPHVTFSLRGGFAQPTASSEVFSFASKQLTVGRGDFGGASLAADLGIRLTDRFELQFGGGAMTRNVGSEFRHFVGTDDKPIQQTTALKRIPMTAGFRYHLTPTGRSLSQLAWVPAKWTPFVGAGGGAMYYQFRQNGEFVDYKTLDVFNSTLDSRGWTPTGYANAGIDYSLSPRLGLITEARYDYARATMSKDFQSFDRIDLSGVSATVGFNIRF